MIHPTTARKEALARALVQSFAALGFGVYNGYQSVYVWELGGKSQPERFPTIEEAKRFVGMI